MKVVEIPIAEISVGRRIRPAREAAVVALSSGIAEDGVRQPIEVCRAGKGWRLVSGLHRLEASKRAGLNTIPAVVITTKANRRLLQEATENLTRNDLSPMERAQALAAMRRVHLYEHPEAGRGRYDRTLKSNEKA